MLIFLIVIAILLLLLAALGTYVAKQQILIEHYKKEIDKHKSELRQYREIRTPQESGLN